MRLYFENRFRYWVEILHFLKSIRRLPISFKSEMVRPNHCGWHVIALYLDSHLLSCYALLFQDQATEVILTLGQAFEVAYQMALRDGCNRASNGHMRSHSVNQITSQPSVHPVTTQPQTNHSRSHSVNEIKINGNSSPAKTESDSIARAPIVTSDDV